MDEVNALITAASGLTGVSGGVGVAWLLLRAYIANQATELRDLRARIVAVAEKEIGGLSRRLDGMEDRCLQHRDDKTVARLEVSGASVQQSLTRIESKLDGVREDVSGLRSRVESHEGWIRDVRAEAREHASNPAVHGGSR